MAADVRVEPGAAVEATDGRLGTVDEVIVQTENGALAYLLVRRGWGNEQLLVPAELIDAAHRNGGSEVRLLVSREQARARAADVPTDALLLAGERGAQIVIPVVEERLQPDTQTVDLGELLIHKRVDGTEEVVAQPVTRDDLVVERVPVNRPLDAPVESRQEGEWLVIPIMREVLVVKKQLMLVEEVRVSKRTITETQEVRETVRHERVELEDATAEGVKGLAGPPEGVAAGPPEGAVATP